jgi:hypothetical protein
MQNNRHILYIRFLICRFIFTFPLAIVYILLFSGWFTSITYAQDIKFPDPPPLDYTQKRMLEDISNSGWKGYAYLLRKDNMDSETVTYYFYDGNYWPERYTLEPISETTGNLVLGNEMILGLRIIPQNSIDKIKQVWGRDISEVLRVLPDDLNYSITFEGVEVKYDSQRQIYTGTAYYNPFFFNNKAQYHHLLGLKNDSLITIMATPLRDTGIRELPPRALDYRFDYNDALHDQAIWEDMIYFYNLDYFASDPGESQLPPASGTTVPPDYDLSPDGLGKVPLPENASQAMAGIVIPGIISVILGILGQSGAAVAPGGGTGSSTAKSGSAYDFGDGRDYYEGQSYTFDDGREYKIVDGEFVPTKDLNNGATYVDPDGNSKIWIGGQAWHEADWRRQAATNDAYVKTHKQDVDSYWEKRQQEIHEEQAALQAEEKARAELEEHEAYKEMIRQKYDLQHDESVKEWIEREQNFDYEEEKRHLDYSKSQALTWGENIAIGVKFAADSAIDVGAVVVPGGKYVKAGYKIATGAIETGYKDAEIDVYKGIRGAVGGAVEAAKDFIPADAVKTKFILNVGSEVVKSDDAVEGVIKGVTKGGVELVTQRVLNSIGFTNDGYKADYKTFFDTVNDQLQYDGAIIMDIFGGPEGAEKAAKMIEELNLLDISDLGELFFTEPVNPASCQIVENLIKDLGNYISSPKKS